MGVVVVKNAAAPSDGYPIVVSEGVAGACDCVVASRAIRGIERRGDGEGSRLPRADDPEENVNPFLRGARPVGLPMVALARRAECRRKMWPRSRWAGEAVQCDLDDRRAKLPPSAAQRVAATSDTPACDDDARQIGAAPQVRHTVGKDHDEAPRAPA